MPVCLKKAGKTEQELIKPMCRLDLPLVDLRLLIVSQYLHSNGKTAVQNRQTTQRYNKGTEDMPD